MKKMLNVLSILTLIFAFSCSSNKKKKSDAVIVSSGENSGSTNGTQGVGMGGSGGSIPTNANGAPPLYSDGSSTYGTDGSGSEIGTDAINAGVIDTSDIVGGSVDGATYSGSANYSDSPFEVNGSSDDMNAGGLSTVYFPFNSASLISTAKSLMDSNISFLKDNPSVSVQIEGHCDERGSVQYNLALGERRANSIKDYFVSKGISAFRVSTISYGKERPLDYTQDESGWAKNRRVNFIITAK